MAISLSSALGDAHSFPNTALFFPVIKRFAVDLVDGSLRNRHAARLSGHEEINVVNCAVRSFHIYAREIFAAAQTGKPIVVDPQQIERQIFASVVDVELFVAGFLAVARDVPLDSGRDIGPAHFRCRRSTLRRSGCYLCPRLRLRSRMFCSEERHSRRQKQCDRYGDDMLCIHTSER
jgi:hypothetical protein